MFPLTATLFTLLALATHASADPACPNDDDAIYAGACHCVTPAGYVENVVPGCLLLYNNDGTCSGSCAFEPDQRRRRRAPPPPGACPAGRLACPAAGNPGACIAPRDDADNCGGCVALGHGRACRAIPGVEKAACRRGMCEIYSCRPRYALDVAGTRCVPVAKHVKRVETEEDML